MARACVLHTHRVVAAATAAVVIGLEKLVHLVFAKQAGALLNVNASLLLPSQRREGEGRSTIGVRASGGCLDRFALLAGIFNGS